MGEVGVLVDCRLSSKSHSEEWESEQLSKRELHLEEQRRKYMVISYHKLLDLFPLIGNMFFFIYTIVIDPTIGKHS